MKKGFRKTKLDYYECNHCWHLHRSEPAECACGNYRDRKPGIADKGWFSKLLDRG